MFQRTPNFCWPARHGKVDPDVVESRQADYDGFANVFKTRSSAVEAGFIEKGVLDATEEERKQVWDEMWLSGRHSLSGLFQLTSTCIFNKGGQRRNAVKYMARIREKVKGPGDRRKADFEKKPSTTGYQASAAGKQLLRFNSTSRMSCLVDVNENTDRGDHPAGDRAPAIRSNEFDIIVFATAFDGMTRARLKKDQPQRRDGQQLCHQL